MLRDLKVADSPWYSRMEPKLLYELEETYAYWDVLAYAKHTSFRANGVEARFVYHKAMRVLANTTIAITRKSYETLTTIKVHSLARDPTTI